MSRGRKYALAMLALWAGLLLGAAGASADSSQSANWAGYAAHGSRVHFRSVSGSWTQPKVSCTAGQPAYSSLWVGLGGYSISSRALEQIGTEADCSASGRIVSSAWYELVPAPSRAIALTVAPGDRIHAEASVSGREVTLQLSDLTRHRTFRRTVRASPLDTTSAEWILEAPSLCSTASDCQTLPLADFGSAAFTAASAVTTTGERGTVSSRRWTTTRISLAQVGRQFISGAPSGGVAATAVPSQTTRSGSSFRVVYEGSPVRVETVNARSVSAARLVHAAAR
jgi:hypothetical protein